MSGVKGKCGGARPNSGPKSKPLGPCSVCGGADRYDDGECKRCCKRRSKEYRERMKAEQPELYASRCRAHSKKHHEANKGAAHAMLIKRLYGLTTDEYSDKLRAQGYSCLMCGAHQANLKYRLAVDHCHRTGKVRGLLCPKCNNAVAAYENHKEHIEAYLELFK